MHISNLFVRTSNTAVNEQKHTEEELSSEVEVANRRIQEINEEIGTVHEQLGEAKVSNNTYMNGHIDISVFSSLIIDGMFLKHKL